MASTDETHSRVAALTRQGQPETLHRQGDDGARKRAQTTPRRPAAPQGPPVRSITRGKAEEASSPPASKGCDSREGEPDRKEPPKHANRCLVVGSDGIPLMPCTVQRAAKLRRDGRARLHAPEPYCIEVRDRKADDPDVGTAETEVRVDPGARHTGITIVMMLENEDRVVYQEDSSTGTTSASGCSNARAIGADAGEASGSASHGSTTERAKATSCRRRWRASSATSCTGQAGSHSSRPHGRSSWRPRSSTPRRS